MHWELSCKTHNPHTFRMREIYSNWITIFTEIFRLERLVRDTTVKHFDSMRLLIVWDHRLMLFLEQHCQSALKTLYITINWCGICFPFILWINFFRSGNLFLLVRETEWRIVHPWWLPFTNLLNEVLWAWFSYDYGDWEDFEVTWDASHDFLNINRAYRKTGAGDDIAEHFSVIADLTWPDSTMILWPDKILGATLATGSLKKNITSTNTQFRTFQS